MYIRSRHTKTIIKMVKTASLHGTRALGEGFDSAARLSTWPGNVLGHKLKRSPGTNRSRISI